MEINEYQEQAKRTLKILGNEQADLQHMMYGISSEIGELMSMLKAHYVYGRPFDIVNLKEELGDAAWFLVGACTIMGLDANEVFEKNIEKLKSRYPEKFTEENANNRDLEKERKTLE